MAEWSVFYIPGVSWIPSHGLFKYCDYEKLHECVHGCESGMIGLCRALAEDSMGHKMLQKLGWKKGEGLGKNSKGITEPVCTLHIHLPYN